MRSDLCGTPAEHLKLFSRRTFCLYSRRLRWGCKGNDLLSNHQNFLKVFCIFNYLSINDLSIGKVQYTYLIINPLFYKEQWLFEADGKDSIFITRSKNYFNLIAVYYAVFQIDIKRLSLSTFSVLENNDDTGKCKWQDVAWPGVSSVAVVIC